MADFADLARVPSPRAVPRWRRYAQTIAHLRPEQMARLFARRVLLRPLRAGVPAIGHDPVVRGDWARSAPFLDDPAAMTFRPDARVVRLIQLEKALDDPVDWVPAGMPLLWQLELNYFHWMPGDLSWPVARRWIVDWLDHAPRGVRSPCWNPYAVAQRVLRWTRLIRGPWWDDLLGDPLRPRLLRELYAQCRFLARNQETELLGNHLLKTAVALYAAGRFFAGAEADGWRRRAEALIARELQSQVLADGGHYERSPMYHLLVLVDLVDARNITPPGDRFEDVLRRPIAAMYRFAAACAHGDGEIPLFNDSALGQAPGRAAVLRYVERVGGGAPEFGAAASGFVALPHFGLFRLGDRDRCFWLDAGETGPPFLQAHAHADTGSFELSVGPRRIVCDRGVSTYQDPARRTWDRSTAAHSTLVIAGESSSDCWGSFRVARRARIRALSWTSGREGQTVTLRHDGFRHLPASPRHQRSVTFRDGTYTIRDRVECDRATRLRCDAFLYLGPGVTATSRGRLPGGDSWPEGWDFDLGHREEPGLHPQVEVSFSGPLEAADVFLEPASFAPAFHADRPGSRIRAACVATARVIEIHWTLRT